MEVVATVLRLPVLPIPNAQWALARSSLVSLATSLDVIWMDSQFAVLFKLAHNPVDASKKSTTSMRMPDTG